MPLDKDYIDFEVAQSALLRRRLIQGELLLNPHPFEKRYRSTFTLLGASLSSLPPLTSEIPETKIFLRRKTSASARHHHSAIYFYEVLIYIYDGLRLQDRVSR